MSIRYFDVKESGIYTMILSNTAKEKMNYQVEIGSTDRMNISIPTGVMFVGGLLLLFTSYIKLKNYRIEQPDENIK
jgi:predicted histidine transporter YuiF (NhaC family)